MQAQREGNQGLHEAPAVLQQETQESIYPKDTQQPLSQEITEKVQELNKGAKINNKQESLDANVEEEKAALEALNSNPGSEPVEEAQSELDEWEVELNRCVSHLEQHPDTMLIDTVPVTIEHVNPAGGQQKTVTSVQVNVQVIQTINVTSLEQENSAVVAPNSNPASEPVEAVTFKQDNTDRLEKQQANPEDEQEKVQSKEETKVQASVNQISDPQYTTSWLNAAGKPLDRPPMHTNDQESELLEETKEAKTGAREQDQIGTNTNKKLGSEPDIGEELYDDEYFKEDRPKEIDSEGCENIEDAIRELYKLKQGKEEVQFKKQHEENQVQIFELDYYMRLYSKVFDQVSSPDLTDDRRNLSPQEKQRLGYEKLAQAKKNMQLFTPEKFKEMDEQACKCDEKGVRFEGEGSFYHSENGSPKDEPFEMLLQKTVFQALKHQGNLRSLISSEYFIGPNRSNEFQYKASQKMPFYFLYYACPEAVREEMMQKYLDNPINPLSFVTYEQYIHEGQDLISLRELQSDDQRVQRTIHVSHAYHKLKEASPNLLCIGDAFSGKSTLINDIFGLQFEVINSDSAGLFHDSVDTIFNSKAIPTGFNVYDFQGQFANNDMAFIEKILETMPNTFLLIQISKLDYLKSLQLLSRETREKFAKRVYIIFKNLEQREKGTARRKLSQGSRSEPAIFPGLAKDAIKDMQDIRPGEVVYTDKCFQIFNELRMQIEALEQEYKMELARRKDEMNMLITSQNAKSDPKVIQNEPSNPSMSKHRYEHIYGFYWLFQDCFTTLRDGSQVQVKIKDQMFRKLHMSTKLCLYSHDTTDPQQMAKLSRKQVFPGYTIQLEIRNTEKQLKNRGALVSAEIEELQKKKNALEKQKVTHGQLFNNYLEAYLQGDQTIVDDLLELIESHYMPRVEEEQKIQRDIKSKIEGLNEQIEKLQFEKKSNSRPEIAQEIDSLTSEKVNLQKELDQVNSRIEDKVLDSELFLREAKQYMLDQPERTRQNFYNQLAQRFENGKAIEIIDGDADGIERASLAAVFQWVQELKNKKKSLLVVTILGPQSSGKSTLLNYLVGAKFHVSAGRCTKGLNAMLLRTDFEETKEILILDSEGIFSIERNDPMYDRRLAIFCMAVSNVLLINIKGELNIEIQKVLQVAIFALKKIVQVYAGRQKVRIQFILRDQIDTSTELMRDAYEILKKSLYEAAKAAGATLSELIDIPANPNEIITMFTNALQKNHINGNQAYEQTISDNGFRLQCSRLRLMLIKISQGLDKDTRVLDLTQWANKAVEVWTAVYEKDDLVQLQDLAQLNAHRQMMLVLDQFRRIMSTPAPVEVPAKMGEQAQSYMNPLLQGADVPETMANEKIIATTSTIFAQFEKVIDLSIKGLGQQTDQSKLNLYMRDQTEILEQLHGRLSAQYADQAKVFTTTMGPEIQNQAAQTVRIILYQIYSKVIHKWHDRQARATSSNQIRSLHNTLKKKVTDSKLNNQELAQVTYAQIVNDNSKRAKEEIKKTLVKNAQEVQQAAERAFQIIATNALSERSEKHEEIEENKDKGTFDLLNKQAKCLFLQDIQDNLTWFEKPDNPDVYVYLNHWAITNEGKLKDQLIQQAKKEDTKYLMIKKEQDELRMEEVKQQKKWLILNDEAKTEELRTKARNVYDEKFSELDRQLEERIIEYIAERQPQLLEEVRDYVEKYLFSFKKDMQALIKKIKEETAKESNQATVIPLQQQKEFVALINRETFRQLQAKESSKIATRCVEYQYSNWKVAFNQILYNILFQTISNQDQNHFASVVKEIDEVGQQAIEFYDELNSAAQSDKGVALMFCRMIHETAFEQILADSLQKYHIGMSGIDVDLKKSKIMESARLRFMETDDEEEIIQYLKSPIDVERKCLDELYNMHKKSQIEQVSEYYKNATTNFVKKANAYINELYIMFSMDRQERKIEQAEETKDPNKGPVSPRFNKLNVSYGASEIQKQDLLKFIYGTLLQGLSNELNDFISEEKRNLVLSHQFFIANEDTADQSPSSLPAQPEASFENTNGDNYMSTRYPDDMKKLECIAKTQKSIGTFLEIMKQKFSQVDYEKQTTKFEQAFEAAQSYTGYYKAIEAVAFGCTAMCPFCGARCKAEFPCGQNCKHETDFHLPMAFRGSHEKYKGKKHLLNDYCTSYHNLNDSRWPNRTASNQTEIGQLMERMTKDFQLETKGMNYHLEWSTGSDLDIQVMCGCGTDNWMGYGTSGDSNCVCNKCQTGKDFDIRCGSDGRYAFEHIFFKDPHKLISDAVEKGNSSVRIGMAVHNYKNETQFDSNKFKICLYNQHGYQLYPNKGQGHMSDHPDFFCEAKSGTTSKRFFYELKKEDLILGDTCRTFQEHAKEMARTTGEAWLYSEAKAAQQRTDPDIIRFKKSWQRQWDKVKETLCGPDHYDCEILDLLYQ